jgi:hypothetical protein
LKPRATHHPCDRARSWAALAPDGELSELERTLLRAHLVRCGSCRRFAADVAAIAAALRGDSLEPLPRPISVPPWRRRLVLARARTVGAAAAVAVMALGIASRAPVANEERRPALPPHDRPGEQPDFQMLRNERLHAFAIVEAARRGPLKHFGNQPA